MKSNPILLALLQHLVTCIIIGFTPPRSITRLGAFMIAALCTLQCISTSIDHMVHTPWASLVGGYAVSHLFHYIDIVLLYQWSFKTHGPRSDYDFLVPKSQSNGNNSLTVIPRKDNNSFWAKFRFGIWATCTTRFIGTREQVKNVPLFVRRDPGFVPSRSRFLKHTASFILLCYLGLDVMDNFTDPEVGQRYFMEENIPFFRRLGEITAEEVAMRVSAAIGAAIGLVLVQGGCYNVFAFLSVLLGFTEPREWPPFYGPLSETYTLRRLWSEVWHQTNTHKLNSISRYFVYHVLNFSSRTSMARYARWATAFFISGCMHFLIDISAGIPAHNSGALRFFCTQILGMAIEDMVIKIYSVLTARAETRKSLLIERLMGYAWVGLFLAWSSPAYMYPMMYRRNLGLNDSVVPFSVIGIFRQAL